MSVSSTQVGFIGMGLMGVPMSSRLLAAGFEVTVWNRNPEKTKVPKQHGANVASSIAELCECADIIMLCVSDAHAVKAVMQSPGGVLENLSRGKVIIDFSSIDPETTRALAKEVSMKDCDWIDSPVSGGVAGAEQGTLAIMVGGELPVVERVRPLLEPLSQRITHMGSVGAGQVSKICNQMIVSCNVLVMAEVMALAEKAGVESHKIPTALKGGFADSIPLQLTGPRMAQRDYEPVKWHVKTLLKDLDMAKQLAQENLSAAPMAGLGAELMRQHASQGFAESDPATVIEMYAAQSQPTDTESPTKK